MIYEREYKLYLKPTKYFGDCVSIESKSKLKNNDDISILCGGVGQLVFVEYEKKMYIVKDKYIDKAVFKNDN